MLWSYDHLEDAGGFTGTIFALAVVRFQAFVEFELPRVIEQLQVYPRSVDGTTPVKDKHILRCAALEV
jgi:hypothetical protein